MITVGHTPYYLDVDADNDVLTNLTKTKRVARFSAVNNLE